MALELRSIREDEFGAFRDAVMVTFGDEAESDTNGDTRMRALVEPSQAWAAFDGKAIVATTATFNHTVIVPGGARLPMAGLTMVSVRPTHRRRGLLRQLMQLHLDDARARGMPVSGLWASEASIYRRFGYGVASESDAVEIQNAHALVFADRELDAIEWIDTETARAVLPEVYARAIAERPGAITRSDAWWRERRFIEIPWVRAGASKRRHVIARRGDTIAGYLVYRQRGGFHGGLPSGRVEINELIAIDARAELTLWQFAARVDLFPTLTWWNAPTDDVLSLAVDNPRQVERRRVDNLWLRIDDVARALSARRYARDGRLRIGIQGDTFELVVEAGQARCTAVQQSPALVTDQPTLGALYLGAFSASRLARANLVHGDPSAIALADAMFAWHVAPWCAEVF